MSNEALLSSPPKKPERRAFQIARRGFGYLLAAAFLIWVFHDIHFERLLQHISEINWWLVALGILCDVLSYVCTGLRWHLLLRPVGRIPVWRTTQAIYAGLFLNEILPLRIGELTRGFLVSVWLPTEFVRVIPSMALERLTEGIWLALGVGITAILVPLPQSFVRSADILGIIVLAVTALFIFSIIRKNKGFGKKAALKESRHRLLRSLGSILERLGSGFKDIGLSPALSAAFFCTLGMLTLQAFSFWIILCAYGIRLSFWVGAAVFLIVLFGTALPNAPANVGSYQFFCVLGLKIFGVEKTLAAGFSVVVFILLTLPLLLIGFFAFGQSGMTYSSIKDRIRNLRTQA